MEIVMNIFKQTHIYLDLAIENKEALFDFIGEALKKLGRVTESKDFIRALNKRESEISTGIGDGLAIPHALDTSVLFPTVLYIRLKEPIAYDALDQKPVKEVFSIAMPNSYQKEHLETLSKIANLYLDDATKDALQAANTTSKVYQILSKTLK